MFSITGATKFKFIPNYRGYIRLKKCVKTYNIRWKKCVKMMAIHWEKCIFAAQNRFKIC